MNAYKVTWQTFDMRHSFNLGSEGWIIITREEFFGTKETAENFINSKNAAAKELGLALTLSAQVKEVELK